MSRITNDIITSLRKSLQASDRKTSAYDTQATIRRIENGVAWVHIPGGVDETPVQMTINASEGDTVQVRVSGGRAFLVGNATAPPTDDSYAKRMSKSLSGDLKGTKKTLRGLGRVVEMVKDIASNTNQYFWHTETGSDTGAHITEIPQEEFLADPENGGGNLLARSNGVAVRDGLDELSVFSAEGVRIGRASEGHMEITDHEIKGMGERGMHFDVVGPVYSDTAESQGWGWSAKTKTGYTGYPSYPVGTKVLLARFGIIKTGAEIEVRFEYYYNSATEISFDETFVGGTTQTKTVSGLFSVTYSADTDEIYLTSLNENVHFGAGYAGADQVYAQTNKLQFVFGRQLESYEGGDCSASLGQACDATGSYSVAAGFRTTASGYASHAEGENTVASGEAAHAEGDTTQASGDNSHAEGEQTTASGAYSHAEGFQTEASHAYSHASGLGTVADGTAQTAIGKYNTRNSGNLLSIGNGTSDSARSDAFTVDESGNGAFAGNGVFGGDLTANGLTIKLNQMVFLYTTNTYVDRTSFDRITGYVAGNIAVVNMNLSLSAALPKSSDFVTIGSLLWYTFRQDAMMMVPAGNSTNAGVALVEITAGGQIRLYNYSNTTIPAGSWLRCQLTLPLGAVN